MLLATFIVALILGMVGAIAPLGPVTLLVLRRTMEQDWSGALKVGLGRVPPETIYCGLATFGAAAAIEEFPAAKLWIQGVGTVLLLGLGAYFVFAPMKERPSDAPRSKWGNWSGLIIGTFNPGLMLSWSAVAAIVITTTGVVPTLGQKLMFPAGVSTGVALGYLTLIGTIRRLGQTLNARFIRTVIRIVGTGFLAASVWNIIQLATKL